MIGVDQVLGYLIGAIKDSKGGKKASEELSSAIWEWVRPIFLKDDTPLKDLENEPDNVDNQQEVSIKIKKHIKNNPEEAKTLEQLLENLSNTGAIPSQIKQTHYGTGDNVGGDKIING